MIGAPCPASPSSQSAVINSRGETCHQGQQKGLPLLLLFLLLRRRLQRKKNGRRTEEDHRPPHDSFTRISDHESHSTPRQPRNQSGKESSLMSKPRQQQHCSSQPLPRGASQPRGPRPGPPSVALAAASRGSDGIPNRSRCCSRSADGREGAAKPPLETGARTRGAIPGSAGPGRGPPIAALRLYTNRRCSLELPRLPIFFTYNAPILHCLPMPARTVAQPLLTSFSFLSPAAPFLLTRPACARLFSRDVSFAPVFVVQCLLVRSAGFKVAATLECMGFRRPCQC